MSGRRARERRRNYSGPVVFVLPPIDEDLDDATKNGLAIRNTCSVDGVCPDCGATPTFHEDSDHARIVHLVFEHEDWCGCLRDEQTA